MPREETKQKATNCARAADGQKNYANTLPGDQIFDLTEAFMFYDKEENGIISIAHFRNILHNFGFHRLSKRDIDTDLQRCDPDFMKRNCVDLNFCKHVVGYRWAAKGGREEEARECFKVFDKRERNVVSTAEIKKEVIEQLGQFATDEDVRDFLKEIDPQNTGQVTSKEFVKLFLS